MELGNGADVIGYDTTRAPTKMEMMSLSFDKDMREAGQRVSIQLRNS